jgi:4-hydroxy-tetrahydrodipicolinate reductase
LKNLLEEGINIISTSEGLGNAYAVNPELAAKTDLLARKHEVTVLGTGITPGVFEPLLLILTGLCSKIKRIKYVRVTSAAAYAPNSVVRKNFGVDVKSVDEFEKAVKNGIITGHIGFEWSIPMIADKLGWRIDEIKCELKPFIVNGKVIGSKKICRGTVDGKELIYMELDAHANPEVETYDEFVVEGEPPVNLKCKPFIEGSASTASVIVHMIPIVINAEPGLYTPADLPLPVYYEDVRLLIKKQ